MGRDDQDKRGDSSTRTICSFLGGSCFSTSFFSRRSSPARLVANEGDHVQLRRPQGKFTLPVGKLKGTLLERGQERNGLDGLAKAHLISKDDIFALFPSKVEPVEALQLIRNQSPKGIALSGGFKQ
ncbi:MAG: hypothetical protein FRX49_03595 [Trebouxia sp. A1-2]|nr:MAG: hypothetical protein FRX49_03595 [Trebouxia sp. A1-2]